MSATSAAGSLLRRQLKEMQANKDLPGISCGLVNDGNIFEWEVMLMINDDCKYYGGEFMSCLAIHPLPPPSPPFIPRRLLHLLGRSLTGSTYNRR